MAILKITIVLVMLVSVFSKRIVCFIHRKTEEQIIKNQKYLDSINEINGTNVTINEIRNYEN